MNDHCKKFYVANPSVLGCSRTGLRIKLQNLRMLNFLLLKNEISPMMFDYPKAMHSEMITTD
jgi:hypothetical protein